VGELRPRQRTRAIITGNPIRPELRHGDAARALATLGWPAAAEGEAELEAGAELGADDDDLPVVYVTGGTQGARSINRVIETALPALLPVCRIIHQCGGGADNGVSELDRLTAAAAALSPQLCDRYRPLAFLDLTLLADIYALATLVVGRAGAGTTTELAELGKASVLIPLVPTRRDEQRRNSRLLEDAGAAVVLPQAELSSARLAEVVVELLRDPEQLRRMGKAALQLAHPDAADRLADLVLAAIRTRSA